MIKILSRVKILAVENSLLINGGADSPLLKGGVGGISIQSLHRISGFSLISTIFLVVVLSLIGAFIVNLSSLNVASANLGIQGIRAYYAARSGLEWALYVATTPVAGVYNCPSGTSITTCPTGYTGTTNTLSLTQAGLKNFTVVVTCCQNLITEGTSVYNIYQLNATSQYGTTNSPDFVSRTLYFTATDPRG